MLPAQDGTQTQNTKSVLCYSSTKLDYKVKLHANLCLMLHETGFSVDAQAWLCPSENILLPRAYTRVTRFEASSKKESSRY